MTKKIEKPSPLHAMDMFNAYLMVLFVYIYTKTKKSGKEKVFLMYVLGLSSIHFLARLLEKPKMFNIYHVLLSCYVILGSLFSKDTDILIIVMSILILTISTRKIYNGCLIRNYETNSIITHNSLTEKLNWDWIFLTFSLITLFKIYRIK